MVWLILWFDISVVYKAIVQVIFLITRHLSILIKACNLIVKNSHTSRNLNWKIAEENGVVYSADKNIRTRLTFFCSLSLSRNPMFQEGREGVRLWIAFRDALDVHGFPLLLSSKCDFVQNESQRKNTTVDTRQLVIFHRGKGETYREIGAALRVIPSTVADIIRRFHSENCAEF